MISKSKVDSSTFDELYIEAQSLNKELSLSPNRIEGLGKALVAMGGNS
jgi:hypothetical protein